MRILLALAVVATLAWGGYWVVGSRALDGAVTVVLSENPALDARAHSVRGFPNRFDLTLTEPRVSLEGFDWRAPFVQFFALTYRPHHLIAVFPNDQAFSFGPIQATLASSDMRASVVMRPEPMLPFDRFALVIEGAALTVGGGTHRADALRLASRALGPVLHEIALEGETLFPDAAFMAMMDPAGLLPRRFDVLRIAAEVGLSRPLDRSLLDGTGAEVTALALTGLRALWEDIGIDLTGRIALDTEGLAQGEGRVVLTGWRALLAQATRAGIEVPALLAPALAAVADPADPDRIEVPLVIRDGSVTFGGLVLLTLPPLL
jgi:hypothetical protein